MKLTIQAALTHAENKFKTESPTPKLDAEVLLMHVMQCERHHLYAYPEKILDSEVNANFDALVTRRARGEPIAYLTGTKEFWSLPFSVTKDTLIPRAETELMIDQALALFKERDGVRVADLGTGSGAIALALAKERPNWEIVATDNSKDALKIAEENAHRLDIKNVSFYEGDWFNALPRCDYDLIVSNPPYISAREWPTYQDGLQYEPKSALLAEDDGMAALKIIIKNAKKYLQNAGYLIVEHGFLQGEAVKQLFIEADYQETLTVFDLSLHPRLTIGRSK